jgi:heterodisulfide reductase subunit C
MAHAPTQARAPTFFDEVVAATPGESNLERCIQCGTCAGSCPSSPDMEYTPRAIIAMINAGMQEEVLRANTSWYCVSCYYCMVRCPQDIHVTDIMYTLKRLSIKKGYYRQSTAKGAKDFSQTFIYFVENFGRGFELGLAGVHLLSHRPLGLAKMMPMGMGMMRRGRMSIVPKQIKGIDSLKAVLNKAKELEV